MMKMMANAQPQACPAKCSYAGGDLPQPLPLWNPGSLTKFLEGTNYNMIRDPSIEKVLQGQNYSSVGCTKTPSSARHILEVSSGAKVVPTQSVAQFTVIESGDLLTIDGFKWKTRDNILLVYTDEDSAGTIYSMSYQMFFQDGPTSTFNNNLGTGNPDGEGRGDQFFNNCLAACNEIVTTKTILQQTTFTQAPMADFTFPGGDVTYPLQKFISMSALDVIKDFCSPYGIDTSEFDDFTLDYNTIQMEEGAGIWVDVNPTSFAVDIGPPFELTVSGSNQVQTKSGVGAFADKILTGNTKFRLCADGTACTKNSEFWLKYIDCQDSFKWNPTPSNPSPFTNPFTVDQPAKVTQINYDKYEILIDSSMTGSLVWTFPTHTHDSVNCGAKTLTMSKNFGDALTMNYYNFDVPNAQFTLDLDSRPNELLRVTKISGQYTLNSTPAQVVSTTETIEITEILCTAIAAKPEYVVFANTEPTKQIDFLGLNALDAGCRSSATHSFVLAATVLPNANYPWLTFPGVFPNALIMGVPDVDAITYGGRYTGKHTQGKASEEFDLVVCAMTPPASWYNQGQPLKEYQKDIQTDNIYTIKFNSPTAVTTDTSCGTLLKEVTYNFNGKYDPRVDALKYQVSADNLEHTFTNPWLYPETNLQVTVSFRFSNHVAAAYQETFQYDVKVCSLVVPALVSPPVPQIIPLTSSYQVLFPALSFSLGSSCTFDKYKVHITDKDMNTLELDYLFNAGTWVGQVPTLSSPTNKMDFISVDVPNNKVVLDKATLDSKGAALSNYVGDYIVRIYGGDRIACCSTTVGDLHELTFKLTQTVVPVVGGTCNQPNVIDLLDTSLLLRHAETQEPIQDEVLFDVSLFQNSQPSKIEIDLTQIKTDTVNCGSLVVVLDSTHSYVTLAADFTSIEFDFKQENGYIMPVYERVTTIRLKIYHLNYATNTDTYSFTLRELDCSVRFPSKELLLSPFTLNTKSLANYTLPVAKETPQACILNPDQSQILMDSGDGNLQSLVSQPWAQQIDSLSFTMKFEDDLSDNSGAKLSGLYSGAALRSNFTVSIKDLDFKVPVCWIQKPEEMFVSSSAQPPFYIDRSGQTSLIVSLTPYTVNDGAYCGPLLYQARSEHSLQTGDKYDMFLNEDASLIGTQIVVQSPLLSPRGYITVKVSVSHAFAANEPAFTVEFPIRVIDCLVKEDYLEFTKEPKPICQRNSPPGIKDHVSEITVLSGESKTIRIGTPFDKDGDSFSLIDWGIKTSLSEQMSETEWIRLTDNEAEETAITFEILPTYWDYNETVSVYLELRDEHAFEPMSSFFTLNVTVLTIDYLDVNLTENSSERSQEQAIMNVTIAALDRGKEFQISFYPSIRLPLNCTEWNSNNEGSNRTRIIFKPTEETKTIIYDQDIEMQMDWQVIDVNVTKVVWTSKNHTRALQKDEDEFNQTAPSNETEAEYGIVEASNLTIRVNFTENQVISFDAEDSIYVELLSKMFAESEFTPEQIQSIKNGNQKGLQANLTVNSPYSEELMQMIQDIIVNTDQALKYFVGSNIFMSFFLVNLLQYLWGLINTLQIIVMTDLFSLRNVPPNATLVMQMILKLCTLEFFDVSFLLEWAFNFRKTSAFMTKTNSIGIKHSKFADAGYGSAIFFELMGPLLVGVVVFCVLTFLRILAMLILKKCTRDNCLRRRLLDQPNYCVILTRFLLEGVIGIGLSSIIALQMLDSETSYENPWEKVSNLFALLSLIALFVTPFSFIKMFWRYLEEVEIAGEASESQYYELFEYYRTNMWALWYTNIFFARRYVLVLAITLLQFSPLTQVHIHMLSTLYTICYLASHRPHYSPLARFQELVNETFVLLAAYPLLCFSPWVYFLDRRIHAGWCLTACILLSALFNAILLFVVFIIETYRQLKLRYKRRIARKNHEKAKVEQMKTNALKQRILAKVQSLQVDSQLQPIECKHRSESQREKNNYFAESQSQNIVVAKQRTDSISWRKYVNTGPENQQRRFLSDDIIEPNQRPQQNQSSILIDDLAQEEEKEKKNSLSIESEDYVIVQHRQEQINQARLLAQKQNSNLYQQRAQGPDDQQIFANKPLYSNELGHVYSKQQDEINSGALLIGALESQIQLQNTRQELIRAKHANSKEDLLRQNTAEPINLLPGRNDLQIEEEVPSFNDINQNEPLVKDDWFYQFQAAIQRAHKID